MSDRDRDWLEEAICLATYDIEEPAPHELQWQHLRALWDMNCAMTLRLADVHLRAQQAEAERDSLKVQLQAAQDALKEVYKELLMRGNPDFWKEDLSRPPHSTERGARLRDEMDAGKAWLEATGQR